jgi:hypothetical protein
MGECELLRGGGLLEFEEVGEEDMECEKMKYSEDKEDVVREKVSLCHDGNNQCFEIQNLCINMSKIDPTNEEVENRCY